MADLFDRYGVAAGAGATVTPKGGDLFDRYAAGPSSGGVQDWEPSQQPRERSFGEDAADWLKTRVIKAGTSFAGNARGLADTLKSGAQALGAPPAVANALQYSNPVTLAGQFMPSTQGLNTAVFDKAGVRQKNLLGPIGKAVDIGVETAIQAPVLGGNALRQIVPAFVGGAAQELVGQATEGTPYEVPARVLTGMLAGGGTAALQNVLGNATKGAANLVFSNARAPEKQAANILGRAMENDGQTFPQIQAQMQPGVPLFVQGGENVKGALRGSTAAPGPARTTAQNAAQNYLEGGDARATAAIDSRVSNLPPVAIRTNALSTERAAASGPAYAAAGIPQERGALKSADRLMLSDDVLTLFKDSPDVQQALKNARRVPELKGEPINSMAVLDRVYKHIGGLEQTAVRAGNGTRAGDLKAIRQQLAAAIGEENPAYTNALRTYSEPSKLIEAASLGKTMFSGNVNSQEVKRVYSGLPADQQKEFLGGVADFLRTRAGNSERATAGERIWAGNNVKERLKAVLPDDEFEAFKTAMEQEVKGGRAVRDVFKGSRTTPMALEAADNAGIDGNVLMRLMSGDRFGALLDVARGGAGRVAEGRTAKVNNVLAQWLTETDPDKIGLVASLAERGRLSAAATAANRRNALGVGAVLPATGGTR